jgi:murein DD-endopeptidase MepM/ murein hydrolase activator NlpD/endonuclease/exonuclease/phosphatase family metal-dependent hydrolase
MLAGCVLVAVLVIVGSSLVFLDVLVPSGDSAGCGEGQAVGTVGLASDVQELTSTQRGNAARVIEEGRRRHLPERAIVIALAVASQESHFLNYANDGEGGDLDLTQLGIERSLQLPHDAVGTDHGSLGVFQQQWPWWGTMRELMDPAQAASKFYTALLTVPGWASLPLTVAAQRVQQSAYPSTYADDEPLARALLRGTTWAATAQRAVFTGEVGTNCEVTVDSGAVVFPLPAGSGYNDLKNWGQEATLWSHGHTGTDLSVACGTPVLAATAGKVIVRTDQPWAGRWLVEVSTGPGRLTTWYAHMRAVDVSPGQAVSAGQQIGEVGDLGNATGCHLHFEVHPHGGSIYQDDVNPSVWLRNNVGRNLQGLPGAGFVVVTFNTLGSSHTTAHGNKPWMASGPSRTRGLVTLLARYHVDVAGLQEFQRPQYQTFLRLAGGTYAVYSPSGDTENSIIWRRDRWQLVSATTFAVPYFDGHLRRMPIVRLRSRDTGRLITFVNVHNPADTSRFPRQGRWRAVAVAREVGLVRRLEERSGGPIVLTGDLNDRRAAFCALGRAGLRAAAGGSSGPVCRPPAHAGIDWILGGPGTHFTSYQVLRDALVRRTTDHPIILTGVR